MKVALITCYKDPNYVRGQVLSQCLQKIPDIDVIEVKNKQNNIFRFIEVIFKLIKVRKYNPDVYLHECEICKCKEKLESHHIKWQKDFNST
jgi:hypothetical protein